MNINCLSWNYTCTLLGIRYYLISHQCHVFVNKRENAMDFVKLRSVVVRDYL